jgi:hypothetical protein
MAGVTAEVVEIDVQARRERPLQRLRRALERDRQAHGHDHVELHGLVRRAPHVQLERRAELERRLEIRHAAARSVVFAVHRDRAIHAEAQLDVPLVEQLAAHTVAIGSQKPAAIDKVRHGHGIDLHLVGAAIVGELDGADPHPELPQRLFLAVRRRRPQRDNDTQRPERCAPSHSNASMSFTNACGSVRGA